MIFKVYTLEDDGRDIYITGNFNSWNPKDENFRLSYISDSEAVIDVPDEILPPIIEFKFTKGGWENVELDKFGSITSNRKISIDQKIFETTISQWRFNWGPFKKEFFPIVEIVAEAFYIPQLERYRKVWILLPYDYYETNRDYPVLYLQDAQNLFNEGSPYGNWEIDKKLALLGEYGRGGLIVVAVDHGDSDRMNEYIFDNDNIAKGSNGKKYIRFITDTLKPYIDQNYRTLRDRENTGIGGSSLGGLISIYSGFLYPEVYSKLLIFSPSLWVEPQNNFPMMVFRKPFKTKIYLYGGAMEGSKMVKRIRHFERSLQDWELKKLVDFDVRVSINPDGTHNEFYWAQEFPRAVEWLYFDSKEDPKKIAQQQLTNDAP